MIYRIEKYDKENKCWVVLFSSSRFETTEKMLKDCLSNNPDVWIRLNTVLATNYLD